MLRLLRLPAVVDRCGASRAKVYNDIRRGLLPAPVRLGARASGWPEHEIEAVLAARIAGRTESELRHLVAELVAERQRAPLRVAR